MLDGGGPLGIDLHALRVAATDEALLKDRRILRDEGFVTVIVVVDASTGKISSGPEVLTRGFAEDEALPDVVVPRIKEAIEEATGRGVTDSYQLQQIVRRTVGSYIGGKLRRRPMIIPVVIEA